mgnify:CR=1 FL=1|jgi:hypothetical protein
MLLKNVTGFADVQGTSQKGQGRPYSIGRLYRLTPIREWENEHGRARCVGYQADERNALDIDLARPNLVEKLISFSDKYPLDLDIIVEPHPEDPLKNVIVDVKLPIPKA